jgi:hypothetical protein
VLGLKRGEVKGGAESEGRCSVVDYSVVTDGGMYHLVTKLHCCLVTRCDYIRPYNIQHIAAYSTTQHNATLQQNSTQHCKIIHDTVVRKGREAIG